MLKKKFDRIFNRIRHLYNNLPHKLYDPPSPKQDRSTGHDGCCGKKIKISGSCKISDHHFIANKP